MLDVDEKEIERLRADYAVHAPLAQRLVECLGEQITTLLGQNGITLGVPMETRVKAWDSVSEKLKRKALILNSVCDLEDMAGIRLILLFRDDLAKMDEILRASLDVVSGENTADRLDEMQFGYQSNHYVVRIPKHWAELPSYAGLRTLTAEIQVRTVAQHIWAAASHKLQYKREASVPPALRRTIHRVSALLETVDLEFSRVLSERDTYLATAGDDADLPLNVDSLVLALPQLFPPENAYPNDDYDGLLLDLQELQVTTLDQLRKLIGKHRDKVMADEKSTLEEFSVKGSIPSVSWIGERVEQGVYFTLVGLARKALREEFGEDRMKTVMARHQEHIQKKVRSVQRAEEAKAARGPSAKRAATKRTKSRTRPADTRGAKS